MIWPRNPRKKARSILKKIESGQASYINIASLAELLDKKPSMVPEVIRTLTSLIEKGDIKACSSAIAALNMAAEKDIEMVADSESVIVGCIRRWEKDLQEDCMLNFLEILLKIYQKYPERMNIAVSELFMCLENASAIVREDAYFLLALLTATHPEFFRGRSKELIRVLNGLNVDERIYACRLIKKLAEKDPIMVADTYDVLEDLRLNHPYGNLRSEAAYAVENLTVREKVVKNRTETGAQERMLEIVLGKMISSNVIEAVIIMNHEGKILATSGHPIDGALLNKLTTIITLESNAEPRSKVILEHADKKVVAVRVNSNTIMVAMTGMDIPLGMVLTELNGLVEEIDAACPVEDDSGVSDKPLSEFVKLIIPNEKDMEDMLEEIGLSHMINKK